MEGESEAEELPECDSPELQRDIERLREALRGAAEAEAGETQGEERLERLLAVNREATLRCAALSAQLERRRAECEERIRSLSRPERARPGRVRLGEFLRRHPFSYFRLSQCGSPYFKKKDTPLPLPNEDTLRIKSRSDINYALFTLPKGWSAKDKSKMRSLLLMLSRDIRRDHLIEKLAKIKETNPGISRSELDEIWEEIRNVNNLSLSEVVLPVTHDYDWQWIARHVGRHHTPTEYRAMWQSFLHPSINKAPFTTSEESKLELLIHKHNYQDWEKIAQELGTGRSSYQCFVHYGTGLVVNKIDVNKWTKEEDELLHNVVGSYQNGDFIPWPRVCSYFPQRSKLQVYCRWMYRIRPELKKGKFSPEEDAVILAAIDKYGFDFYKAQTFLPERTVAQVRMRYYLALCRNESACWSVEEDQELLRLVKHYSSRPNKHLNGLYSAIVKHFPGKNRCNIRLRHTTLTNWMKAHPLAELKCAPRRNIRGLNRVAKVDLSTAVENLARSLEKEAETNNVCRQKIINVDTLLTDIFYNKLIEDTEDSVQPEQPIVQGDEYHTINLRRILLLLKANLSRDLFKQSEHALIFPTLLNDDSDITFKPTLRTYSKKKLTMANILPEVSIWNDTKTYEERYYLPPNHQSITACKNIMFELNKHAMSNFKQFSLFGKPKLKAQYEKFMDRCEVLFTWPLILSNKVPQLQQLTMSNDEPIATKSQLITIGQHKKAQHSIGYDMMLSNYISLNNSNCIQSILNAKNADIDLPPEEEEDKIMTLQKVIKIEDKILSIEVDEDFATRKDQKPRNPNGFFKPGSYHVTEDKKELKTMKKGKKNLKGTKKKRKRLSISDSEEDDSEYEVMNKSRKSNDFLPGGNQGSKDGELKRTRNPRICNKEAMAKKKILYRFYLSDDSEEENGENDVIKNGNTSNDNILSCKKKSSRKQRKCNKVTARNKKTISNIELSDSDYENSDN